MTSRPLEDATGESVPPLPSGELGDRVRALDWSHTILGARSIWPASRRASIDLLLRAPVPMLMAWGPRGVAVYNDAFASLAGDRHPTLLGAPILDGWPEAADMNRRGIEAALRGETLILGDRHVVRRRRGSPEDLWLDLSYAPLLDDDGAVAGVFCVAFDMSARVQAANREARERTRTAAALHTLNATLENRDAQRALELSSSETRFRTLFETAPAPIFLVRVGPGPHAVYDAVNAATERFFGMPARTVLGRSVASTVNDGDLLLAHCLRCASNGLPIEFEITTGSDGDIRTAECLLAPLPVEDEKTQVLIGMARDITAQRLAEDQLRQAQKMEAIGQLTGGIAHDFNNLLTGIIGSLSLMEKRLAQGKTDVVERYVGLAKTSANRAAALTHRLLAFSRRQPLEAKSVDVTALVTSMDELLRRTLGESVALETVVSDEVWPTLCDPHQLENALLNLAINARDAMPDGGRLTIETANTMFDDAASARELGIEPGDYVALSVTDTGTGMSPDVIARAFDPFFTTKPIGQGTGLGLSMIYGFAKQSEGHVKITSEVGQGCAVTIFLPRHGDEGEAAAQASGGEAPRAEAGETVLVVEDDATVRGLVLEVLQELGYMAIEASDGASGLRALHSNRRIDLLITDVGLPGLNGRQLAEQGRARRPDLRILFITGYAENAAFGTGHLDGDMQMMTKPFAVDELATRIREILGQR